MSGNGVRNVLRVGTKSCQIWRISELGSRNTTRTTLVVGIWGSAFSYKLYHTANAILKASCTDVNMVDGDNLYGRSSYFVFMLGYLGYVRVSRSAKVPSRGSIYLFGVVSALRSALIVPNKISMCQRYRNAHRPNPT